MKLNYWNNMFSGYKKERKWFITKRDSMFSLNTDNEKNAIGKKYT